MDLANLFGSVLDASGAGIDITSYLACTVTSIVLGVAIAFFYTIRNRPSKSVLFTMALLPTIVQLVIMLVNGNIGAGIAVMGAFSLVRFRSMPGSARDIAAIFMAMAIGLATGMGFLGIAALFAIIMGAAMVASTLFPLTREESSAGELKILLPGDFGFEETLEEVFEEFTVNHELLLVKTVDMGSLYQLRYSLVLKKEVVLQDFLDALRCRNGNLEVTYGKKLFYREGI